MASSTYAGIEREFGISQEVAILSVSLFVLGLGSGPLLLGPVSEFVGRRKVYLASYLVFLLFNIPVALANNIGESPGRDPHKRLTSTIFGTDHPG
jgi:MFS family permease